MSSNLEQFEEMAERFRRETGYLHPGKDAPSEGFDGGYDVRAAVFATWVRMTEKSEALRAQVAGLERKREILEDALAHINAMPAAYPPSIFKDPDWKRAHEVLTANGMTLDGISAHNMRTAIMNAAEIARKALAEAAG